MIDKWGREEIVGDYVRLIRTLRPDVMLTMNIQGRGGDRAHEATTILVREAYRAAGDPAKYPEQITEGLRPWQPKKLYFTAGVGVIGGRGGPGGAVDAARRRRRGRRAAAPRPPAKLDAASTPRAYDALLGRTYAEIGTDARSNHKCQGMGGLPPLPGVGGRTRRRRRRRRLSAHGDARSPAQMDKDETSLFDGIDTSLAGLAQYAGPNPPAALTAGLAAIVDQARSARRRRSTPATTPARRRRSKPGLAAVRALRAQLGSMGLSRRARATRSTSA